ncbi:MAG: hypothetical protein KGL99_16590 [Burkholderiales bacterium]|nr:hypothetical protein [Burkholderiales bacterium]
MSQSLATRLTSAALSVVLTLAGLGVIARLAQVDDAPLQWAAAAQAHAASRA